MTSAPSSIAQTFLGESRRYLRAEYITNIERAINPLTDEQIWWRPNEESNSIGNLMLHLSGNVHQWIVGGIGQLPDERNRQQEFDERSKIPKTDLTAKLRGILVEADDVLAKLDEATLLERRAIQGSDLTVAEALYHVVEHFSGHTAQIMWIAKSLIGRI